MTRRDYIMLANLIWKCTTSDTPATIAKNTFIVELCRLLHHDNPRFDSVKFMAACGMKEEATPTITLKGKPEGRYYTLEALRENGKVYAIRIHGNTRTFSKTFILHDLAGIYQYTLTNAQMQWLDSVKAATY